MRNYLVRRNGNNNEVNVFDDAFDNFFKPVFFDNYCESNMKTDIKENEREYTLEVEMCGLDKNDISVDYDDGYVTVSGERHIKEEDKKGYIKSERSTSFKRSYYVGAVERENIKAKYENGLLSVVIPKEEAKKPENLRIAIE